VTVFTVAAAVIGTASCLASYLTFQALLSEEALESSIGDRGVLRAVVGGGLYLIGLGLLGFGLGAILRSSAAATAALFGLLFVPQILLELLPGDWRTTIGPYLPMRAGEQIYILRSHEAGSLGPWTGFGAFCLYAAAALTVAFVLINHRDA
jgi:ABC-2 type transport system permease protein